MKEAPDIASQLDYWFAHGVNSIYGRKPVVEKATSPKLNPPKTGTPSAAQPEKTAGRTAKALKELEPGLNNRVTHAISPNYENLNWHHADKHSLIIII